MQKTYLHFHRLQNIWTYCVVVSLLFSHFTRWTRSPPRIFGRPQMLDSCMYFVPPWTMQRHQLAHWCACLWTRWEAAGAPAEKPGGGRGKTRAAHRKAPSQCHQTSEEGRCSNLAFITFVWYLRVEFDLWLMWLPLPQKQEGLTSQEQKYIHLTSMQMYMHNCWQLLRHVFHVLSSN